ncbi:hypothetical protein E4U41_003833 [Claviceps citrina]|nr:hypothetical protein E4U41_003833 [Claviceps citrina]
MNTRNLAWAYGTSAGLATGAQRGLFRHLGARVAEQAVGDGGRLGRVRDGVERCWAEMDGQGSAWCHVPCDWRDVYEEMNPHVLFL